MKYQHCVLLPFALLLLGAGLVCFLLFGIGNLEPYAYTKNFRTATCIVIYSNISGSASCHHRADSGKVKHKSRYPCLEILVNYTETKNALVNDDSVKDIQQKDIVIVMNDTGPVYTTKTPTLDEKLSKDMVKGTGVMLYDKYDSWTMKHTGESNATCSINVCKEDEEDNEETVKDFQENYGNIGEEFQCYFNPDNHQEVFVEVVTDNSVLHALVWPSLAMGFGLFLLVVVAFLSCEVWICRNPKRAQRQLQGQTYHMASRDSQNQGFGETSFDGEDVESVPRNKKRSRKPGDGNNNSRLPKLSAAADIIRKWSFRGRTGSSNRNNREPTDTNRTSQSFGGEPSKQWSISKNERHFPTT